MQFNPDQSRAWMMASLLSIGTDAFVMDPITIFITVLIHTVLGVAKTVAKPGEDPNATEHDSNAPPTRPDAYRLWLAEEERLKREGRLRPIRRFKLRKQNFIDAMVKSME